MERLEGRDLSRVLFERGSLEPALAAEYALQACEALATAHASGIIHRDIKPENLFLTSSPNGADIVKVLDFGISKVALTGVFDNTVPLVRTLGALGSPVYMSPEQIRAWRDLDGRSDIWGFGCLLYELLTGKPAFDAPSIMQICAMILEKDPVPLRTIVPDLDPALEAIVVRCLEKDRSRRFQNVSELAVALAAFAPEHARVWAERCCHVLKTQELAPFNWGEDVDPRSTGNGSNGGVAISVRPQRLAAIDDDVTSFRPPLKWSRVVLSALAIGAVAGLILTRHPAEPAPAPPEHAAAAAPEPALTAPRPIEAPPPVPAADPAPAPEPAPARAAGPSTRPMRAVPKPSKPHVEREKPPRSTASSSNPPAPPAVEAEPDVGF
jgi:serine/threonine-protein kinase